MKCWQPNKNDNAIRDCIYDIYTLREHLIGPLKVKVRNRMFTLQRLTTKRQYSYHLSKLNQYQKRALFEALKRVK